MHHITMTPFGRPMTAGLMAARALAMPPAEGLAVSRWEMLRALTAARAAFGITDRDLAVLQALLSFLPEDEIRDTGTIVFPSNARLSERAHGMAESSLRRHLAALVAAGLVVRHDSPNGKRYAARGSDGGISRAFGFDLAPLAARQDEILAAAQAARDAAEALRRLREEVVLTLRDAGGLIAYGLDAVPGLWDDLADAAALLKRRLRRRLEHADLAALLAEARTLLGKTRDRLPRETEEMDGSDGHSGRHIQDSTRNILESELSLKRENRAGTGLPPPRVVQAGPEEIPDDRSDAEPGGAADDGGEAGEGRPVIPLYLVLQACPDLLDYAPQGIRHWHELVAAAAFVRGMLGISEDAWDEACRLMGRAEAAVSIACLLQRAGRIARPGGYLRALSRRAAEGGFSTGPMVMALLRAENRQAA